jgi:hypothetical protein
MMAAPIVCPSIHYVEGMNNHRTFERSGSSMDLVLASKKMDRTSRACKIKTMGIVLAKEEILPRYLGVLNYVRS